MMSGNDNERDSSNLETFVANKSSIPLIQLPPSPEEQVLADAPPSYNVVHYSQQNIPYTERWKMFLLIGLFIAYTFLLFLNFILSIVGIVILYAKRFSSVTLQGFIIMMIPTTVVSFVELLILPVAAFFGWLLPIYYAYKNHSLFCFIWFFMVMVVQCFVWLFIPIGIPTINVGIVQGLIMFYAETPMGIVFFIASGLWLLMVIGGVIAIISIMLYVVRNYKLSLQVTAKQVY